MDFFFILNYCAILNLHKKHVLKMADNNGAERTDIYLKANLRRLSGLAFGENYFTVKDKSWSGRSWISEFVNNLSTNKS